MSFPTCGVPCIKSQATANASVALEIIYAQIQLCKPWKQNIIPNSFEEKKSNITCCILVVWKEK